MLKLISRGRLGFNFSDLKQSGAFLKTLQKQSEKLRLKETVADRRKLHRFLGNFLISRT
jgi:hypothetical protein